MKKIITALITLTAVICLIYAVGVANRKSYEIALITDVGQLMDGGFNEATYEAVKSYAEANDKTYTYYRPGNNADASDNNRIAAMRQAIKNGAHIIAAPGYLQANALTAAALETPDVKFVFVDGWVLTDKNNTPIPNITAIVYKEHEAGFLAGYAAVKDGYRKLGGTFGGGGSNLACNRFAYGYLQGARVAADEMGVKVEVRISFRYGSAFSSSPELTAQMGIWYKGGTEVIFACGGTMIQSVIAAAGETDNGKIIGVDKDQSSLSDRVITSATKNLTASVTKIFGEYYAGEWDLKLGGKVSKLGAADDCVNLPMQTSRFKKFTQADYDAIFEKLKSGSVVLKDDTTGCDNAKFWEKEVKGSNVRIIYE